MLIQKFSLSHFPLLSSHFFPGLQVLVCETAHYEKMVFDGEEKREKYSADASRAPGTMSLRSWPAMSNSLGCDAHIRFTRLKGQGGVVQGRLQSVCPPSTFLLASSLTIRPMCEVRRPRLWARRYRNYELTTNLATSLRASRPR